MSSMNVEKDNFDQDVCLSLLPPNLGWMSRNPGHEGGSPWQVELSGRKVPQIFSGTADCVSKLQLEETRRDSMSQFQTLLCASCSACTYNGPTTMSI